jgi:UDP-N-acetylglucosamine--N-acetylmuramyl-(pentapeptide) pyrophosphoryl-undecaprenol N-acetylglucosamine transferase
VPYPHAAEQHQLYNALEAAKHKAGFCQPESDWNPAWFKNYMDTLLLDDRRRAEFSRNSASLSRPRAADEIAEEVLSIASASRSRLQEART